MVRGKLSPEIVNPREENPGMNQCASPGSPMTHYSSSLHPLVLTPPPLEIVTQFDTPEAQQQQQQLSPQQLQLSPLSSPEAGRHSPESLSTVDSWKVVAYLASCVDGAELHGYIPKRKGERPEQVCAWCVCLVCVSVCAEEKTDWCRPY